MGGKLTSQNQAALVLGPQICTSGEKVEQSWEKIKLYPQDPAEVPLQQVDLLLQRVSEGLETPPVQGSYQSEHKTVPDEEEEEEVRDERKIASAERQNSPSELKPETKDQKCEVLKLV